MKKAQISIFIIIALIIILSVGSYVYLTQTKELKRIEAQRPIIEQAPTEFKQVVDFTTNCLYDTAKTALIKIGEGGGYIDTMKIRKNPFEPTESEGIELSPGSESTIPYWFYLKDKNTCEGDCKFDTKRIEIERAGTTLTIEGQLDKYINENLDNCINNFKELEKQKYKITAEQPKAETTVSRDDVFVALKYPIKAQKGTTTFDTDTFYTTLQVNFREIYELATQLTNLESDNRYLEKDMRELIDGFSRLDKEALPPLSDLRFDFGIGTIWIK